MPGSRTEYKRNWRKLNSGKAMAAKKRYRQENPGCGKVRRQKHRLSTGSFSAPNHQKSWTDWEMALIVSMARPSDLVLSGLLGRSLTAIQVMRTKIKKVRPDLLGCDFSHLERLR